MISGIPTEKHLTVSYYWLRELACPPLPPPPNPAAGGNAPMCGNQKQPSWFLLVPPQTGFPGTDTHLQAHSAVPVSLWAKREQETVSLTCLDIALNIETRIKEGKDRVPDVMYFVESLSSVLNHLKETYPLLSVTESSAVVLWGSTFAALKYFVITRIH